MKTTAFFQHDTHARSDPKLLSMQMKHGMAGVGIYWCIVELLYENDGYIERDFNKIGYELRADPKLIKSVVEDFNLFEGQSEFICSKRVIEQLKFRMEKSVKARNSINKHWNDVKNRTASV